jgi:ATP:ADP antiporter, AAA family|tara:strand:- start:785 stop:2068 length:1284 start_codon:yes stop_codon:yes gene_type:complete
MNTISERFFPSIRKEEYIPLLKAFGFFFFVLASWYALRPIRNELAVEFGYENLLIFGFSVNPISLLLTIGALVMFAVNPIYSYVVSRIEGTKIVLYCYSFFILNFVLFLAAWTFLQGEGRVWTAYIFYVWLNVYSLFVVSIFWVTLINYFNSNDGKRLFGIISAGGSLGAFFGTSVTQYFALEVCGSDIADSGPSFLIIFSIICLIISIFLSKDLHNSSHTDLNEKQGIGGSSVDAIKSLLFVPQVRNIGIYVLLFTTLATIAWMMSLDIIRNWSSDPCERTSYFSLVEQIVIPLTLMTQLFLSSYIMRRVGTLLILVSYGLLFVLIFSIYSFYPIIAAVFTITIAQRLFEYGLNKPTREVYYANMKKNDRYKSTVMVDTFISRTGDLTGGWIVGFGLISLTISWAALPLALLLSVTGYKAAKSNNQ